MAEGVTVRWAAINAAGNASVGRGGVAGAMPRMGLLPLIGGLFAVVGSLLLVAGMMDAVPLPMAARAAAAPAMRTERPGPTRPERDGRSLVAPATACTNGTRPVPSCQAFARAPGLPLAIAAPHTSTERYRGEGRTLDLLVATPPADMRAAMWAAMARRESDSPSSTPPQDLRTILAQMAAAQRVGRRIAACRGSSEEGFPCGPVTCCGQGAKLSDGDEMALLASVPPDVLFGLQLRAPHEPEHVARVADDRGPAKNGSDDPNANALVVANALPP